MLGAHEKAPRWAGLKEFTICSRVHTRNLSENSFHYLVVHAQQRAGPFDCFMTYHPVIIPEGAWQRAIPRTADE